MGIAIYNFYYITITNLTPDFDYEQNCELSLEQMPSIYQR